MLNGEPTLSIARPPGPGGGDDDSNRAFPQNRPDDSTGGSIPQQNPPSHSSMGTNSSPGNGIAVTRSPMRSTESPQTHKVSGNPSHAGRVAAGTGQSDALPSTPGDTNSTIAASASPPHTRRALDDARLARRRRRGRELHHHRPDPRCRCRSRAGLFSTRLRIGHLSLVNCHLQDNSDSAIPMTND